MIFWTLFSCVLLALSPAQSADMEISITCDTSKPEGPDWKGLAKDFFGAAEEIPAGFGTMLKWGHKFTDVFNHMKNADDGYATQWKTCIKGWIAGKIEEEKINDAHAILNDMGQQLNDTISKRLNDPHISKFDANEIHNDLHDLKNTANEIKHLVDNKNNKEPQQFLGPYDHALAIEIMAAHLYISKLNETYDPKYVDAILHDVGDMYKDRMDDYRVTLNYLEENVLAEFWQDWKIKPTTSGHCMLSTGLACNFKCEVKDPTGHIDPYSCGGTARNNEGCNDFCLPHSPSSGLCSEHQCGVIANEKKAKEKYIKNSVHKLIDGMKEVVENEYKKFDDLTKRIRLER